MIQHEMIPSVDVIVDCDECGLRYMRSVIHADIFESGSAKCACGALLDSWSGAHRVSFEPEDPSLPAIIAH
jgi:hypothetical protein